MDFLSHFFNQSEIKVSHCGERPWLVRHQFQLPANESAIKQAQEEIGLIIPDLIKEFWRRSDGGVLYQNVSGSPWGWRVLGTSRYLESQHRWRRRFFDSWDIHYLVIAELVSPHQAVVCKNQEVFILDEDYGKMRSTKIASDLSDFFQQLIEAQGGLWWSW